MEVVRSVEWYNIRNILNVVVLFMTEYLMGTVVGAGITAVFLILNRF